MRRAVPSLAFGLLFVTFLSGCGAKQAALTNNLKQLGLAYHEFVDAMKRAPKNWQEANDKGSLPPEVQTQLEAAGYVVHWGVNFADANTTVGTSKFILAHPPNAATSGGIVLMLDGSVGFLTAEEFNDAMSKQKDTLSNSDGA